MKKEQTQKLTLKDIDKLLTQQTVVILDAVDVKLEKTLNAVDVKLEKTRNEFKQEINKLRINLEAKLT